MFLLHCKFFQLNLQLISQNQSLILYLLENLKHCQSYLMPHFEYL